MFGKGLKVAALFHCRGNITKYNYPNLITLMQYAYLPPSLHQFSPPFNVFSFFVSREAYNQESPVVSEKKSLTDNISKICFDN